MATVWIFGNFSNSLAFQWATFQHFTRKIGKGLAPRRKPTQQVRPWSRLAPVFFRTRFRKNSFSCGTFLLLKSCNEPFSLGRTDISRKVQSEERNLSFHSGKLCKYDVLIVRQIHRICFLSRIVSRPRLARETGIWLIDCVNRHDNENP